jgi:hypothetical protein
MRSLDGWMVAAALLVVIMIFMPALAAEKQQEQSSSGNNGNSGNYFGNGIFSHKTEVCDGRDNDRDGQVDEGNPGGGKKCFTGKPGHLTQGTTRCQNGKIVCIADKPPVKQEICNGIDDDKDGQIDEGNPGGGKKCFTGKPGHLTQGTTQCKGGKVICVANNPPPKEEICNGVDDDKDGQVDEGNPGGGKKCFTGKPGHTTLGTTRCQGGKIVCIADNPPSKVEVCNGVDDDKDGQIDEAPAGGWGACSTGKPGICAAGTIVCTNGALSCTQDRQPSAEICDGLDNNCDGTVDNGLGTSTCGVGNCMMIVDVCINGQQQVCVPGEPAAEICDGQDNNCDGTVDNGAQTACDDGIACTSESCDASTGQCVSTPDDSACPATDKCSVGQCVAGQGCTQSPVDCDDGNAGTRDSCNPVLGCVHVPVSCDDAIACTTDVFDNGLGKCVSTPDNSACPATDKCSVGQCVAGQGCTQTPVDCDDGNAGTQDSCNPVLGCVNEPVVNCNDGIQCTTDFYDSGLDTCVFIPDDSKCDDGNPETLDRCIPDGVGCFHEPV